MIEEEMNSLADARRSPSARTALEAALERVRAADDGAPWLDCEIAQACGTYKPGEWNHTYTISVDCALSLLDGMDIDEVTLWNDCGTWFVSLKSLQAGGIIKKWNAEIYADLPLAICDAVLQARIYFATDLET